MAGVRLCCPSRFVSLLSALLLLLCFVDAEVPNCAHQAVIHKTVGEDVELSCFQGGHVFEITWEYKGSIVAQYDGRQTFYRELFKDRLYLNPTNFSLTIRNLTLNDSGQFSFISNILENHQPKQLPTVFISLRVNEALTAALTSNSSWNALNASCTVVLECRSEAVGRLWYRWTVRNRTAAGTSFTAVIREEDGDTVFTCTVNNSVSQASASEVLTCSSRAEKDEEAEDTGKIDLITLVLAVVIAACVVTVAAGITLCVCHGRCQKAASESLGDQTVYADVSLVAPPNERQPCSLYDSIDNGNKPVPNSIYDKIQFRYMREPEISDRTAT